MAVGDLPIRRVIVLPADGSRLYGTACASCHGVDGTGASRSRVGFSEALPDFSDCSFATREPDGDWLAVAHQGVRFEASPE